MTVRFRDVEAIIEKAGLEVISLEKNNHIKARVRAPDGRECVQVFGTTPSDHRGMKNVQARLKRFARGEPQ